MTVEPEEEGEQVETTEWASQDSPVPGGEGKGAPVLRWKGAGLGARETARRWGWPQGWGSPPRLDFVRIAL